MSEFNLIVVLGPTASGKTTLGVTLARHLNGEIISADSRQVFRDMDIGTGKDLSEYGDIPYHLIDILRPGEEFSVFAFQKSFYAAFEKIVAAGRMPIMVGGTGLYLEAALRGYRLVEVPENPTLRQALRDLSLEQLQQRLLALKPDQHNNTDLNDRNRLVRAIEIAEGESAATTTLPRPPSLHPLIFGIRWDRAMLRERITRRLKQRLKEGMVDEVVRLHDSGVSWESLEYYGLEYRFIARHLQGQLNSNDLFQKLNSAIHQFAKRQETWFRRMERQGTKISWLDGRDDLAAQALTILGTHKAC
ncbi:MAG: tRNA (adenosine(37)-N6)-dimethylallyltransferase MiaA [Desulfuromonas sp.]|nr:MAG: tRNA (adenosine(37)-N6)-dimethylallyltransferase MiaA [Desulfuromonas sp.]